VTKLIDPRSGRVIKEGTTPVQTVGEFKASGQPVEEPVDSEVKEEVATLKHDMAEIKELLKGLNK